MSDHVSFASMTIPAAQDHIRFARLLVSGMADKVGFDYEAIEDLRIAVHELCVHLVAQVEAGTDLHLRVLGRPSGIEVHASAERPPGDALAPLDLLSEAIVSAVVDEFSVHDAGGLLSISIIRHLGRAA